MNSIKGRIFIILFSVSSLIILIVIPLSTLYFRQKEKLQEVNNTQTNAILHLNKIIKHQYEFISVDSRDKNYYLTGNSKALSDFNYFNNEFIRSLSKLNLHSETYNLNIGEELNAIKVNYDDIYKTFNNITNVVYQKGFKDWGAIGAMRIYAHQIEDLSLNKNLILSIRRHEKDYLLRKEEQYINKLLNKVNLLKKEVSKNNTTNQNQITKLIDLYLKNFKRVVDYDKQLGLFKMNGLNQILDKNTAKIQNQFINLNTKIDNEVDGINVKFKIYYVFISMLLLIIGTIASYYIALFITKPIIKLSDSVNQFVRNDFKMEETIIIRANGKELNDLIKNFIILKHEVERYINSLNKLVEIRTKEINRQKDEIEEKSIEISAQKDQLEHKTKLIEEQNYNIISSIKYAQKIQESYLPDIEFLDTIFKDYFILFKPRDIVSGDFYWADKITMRNKDLTILAVADCTGHGVPGALMSLLGTNILTQAIKGFRITNTDNILYFLNKYVYEVLHGKNKNSLIRDGMDIGIIAINNKTLKLNYSGAFISLFIIRNNEMIEIKGDRIVIGHFNPYTENTAQKFSKHEFQLQKGDLLYLFTDGYKDQFGGEKGKKYSGKRFRNLLLDIHGLELSVQKDFLRKKHYSWKGSYYQVDDILIMGIKIQ